MVVAAAVGVCGDGVGSVLVARDAADGVSGRSRAGAPGVDAEPPVARPVGQVKVNRAVVVHRSRQGCAGHGEGLRRDVGAGSAAGGRIDHHEVRSRLVTADVADSGSGGRCAGSPPSDLEPPVGWPAGEREVDRAVAAVHRDRQHKFGNGKRG